MGEKVDWSEIEELEDESWQGRKGARPYEGDRGYFNEASLFSVSGQVFLGAELVCVFLMALVLRQVSAGVVGACVPAGSWEYSGVTTTVAVPERDAEDKL